MDVIPLIFPCHLSTEQKTELSCIISELNTALPIFESVLEETDKLHYNSFFEISENIVAAKESHCKRLFKYTSYELRMALLKLSFLLSITMKLTSMNSAIMDRILISSIERIDTILKDCHELYLSQ